MFGKSYHQMFFLLACMNPMYVITLNKPSTRRNDMETIKELKLYVAINGNDKHLGTKEAPFATLKKACSVIREKNKEDYKSIQVILREGIHRLDQPITLTAKDAGSANLDITYCAYPGEKVTLSGTKQIHPQWENYQNGIFMCKLEPFDKIDQLFINGQRRILARYPNYDSHNPLMDGDGYINPIDGTDKRPSKQLIYDPLTFSNKEWQNPTTGILHVFQSHFWGNMQYRIKNVDRTNHTINLGYGGFQLQRRFGINHRSRFFVENIFEELDAPGEYFFYDKTASVLYYMPFEYENLHEAIVEIATLDNLFELKGNIHNPVKYITIKGFTITGTCTTFMNPYEPYPEGIGLFFFVAVPFMLKVQKTVRLKTVTLMKQVETQSLLATITETSKLLIIDSKKQVKVPYVLLAQKKL